MKKYAYSIEDLKKLVKSLSGAEKRHFSLLSNTFIKSEKEPLYLKLFHSLVNDETGLSDLDSLPELTTIKKRLFRNILKSLRVFHQDKSIEVSIQNCLSDIEILYSLSLPKQSYYLFQRAYEQAVANEKFTLLLQLLEWEKKLNLVLDQPVRSIDEVVAEERYTLQQLSQLIELENLFGRMKAMKRQYGQVKGELKEDLGEDIGNITEKLTYEACLSQKAKFYYNFTFAIYNWIIYNHKDAHNYSKALLHPGIKVVLPGDYIDGILEHATSCIHIGRFTEALETLQFAQDMIMELDLGQVPVINTKLFFYTVGYRLVIYNYMGDKEQLLYAINQAENEIGNHEKNMPMEAKQVLTANLMNAYLGTGNIKKADELWENLFQKTSKSVRRSIYDDLRLFRLFNLLQHKAYAVIPSMALSAYRYYSKPGHSSIDFELEIKISGLLQKDYDYENEAVRKNILETIKESINEYIVNFNNANNFLEHYTFYIIWIDSIITGKAFIDVAASWYAAYAVQRI